MRFIPAAVAVFATVSLAACASLDIPNPFQRGEQPTPVEQPPAALMQQPAAALAPDIHSYAQPEIARVLHVALDLKGFATHVGTPASVTATITCRVEALGLPGLPSVTVAATMRSPIDSYRGSLIAELETIVGFTLR